jgi:hypothetical protein
MSGTKQLSEQNQRAADIAISALSDWTFTKEDFIAAYELGLKHADEHAQQEYETLREQRIHQIAHLRDDIANFLKIEGFHPIKDFWGVETAQEFDLMLLVRQEDFLSEEFRRVYGFARAMRTKVTEDRYSVNVTFSDQTPEFDENLVVADGYWYAYTFE